MVGHFDELVGNVVKCAQSFRQQVSALIQSAIIIMKYHWPEMSFKASALKDFRESFLQKCHLHEKCNIVADCPLRDNTLSMVSRTPIYEARMH